MAPRCMTWIGDKDYTTAAHALVHVCEVCIKPQGTATNAQVRAPSVPGARSMACVIKNRRLHFQEGLPI